MKKAKVETHISDKKKSVVKELIELMNKKTTMIVSIKNIPSAKFQDMRKLLRGKADLRVAKKSLVLFALEHSKNEKLKELEKYATEDTALIFSNDDAFVLSAFLSKSKTPAKAKIGQIVNEDIIIEAGPTELIPGPDISALSAVGLMVKVENGKLAIKESQTFVKKGEAVTEEKASILTKLNITPFKIGLEPVAAFYEGILYTELRIDADEAIEELQESFGKALAFAVSINYPVQETIVYLLGKAASHEAAIQNLIKQDDQNLN
ncbi:MAG: 50S ribosomal protein L10 [Nanoarchaeota archaeon]|nr:50S ribosomal protein L10 [Nanoarchaeota archaeon]